MSPGRKSVLRIAGGREIHLGSLQALGLYAANSIFVGDYLTTQGQLPEADYKMIQELGFTITRRFLLKTCFAHAQMNQFEEFPWPSSRIRKPQ